ncbi:unnamed protein product [Amoebophrya sp. A25]|nr:unnamed protein product [Amoebophrya sp. A25]|eukprot:GSA25T00026663001.1
MNATSGNSTKHQIYRDRNYCIYSFPKADCSVHQQLQI